MIFCCVLLWALYFISRSSYWGIGLIQLKIFSRSVSSQSHAIHRSPEKVSFVVTQLSPMNSLPTISKEICSLPRFWPLLLATVWGLNSCPSHLVTRSLYYFLVQPPLHCSSSLSKFLFVLMCEKWEGPFIPFPRKWECLLKGHWPSIPWPRSSGYTGCHGQFFSVFLLLHYGQHKDSLEMSWMMLHLVLKGIIKSTALTRWKCYSGKNALSENGLLLVMQGIPTFLLVVTSLLLTKVRGYFRVRPEVVLLLDGE